MTIQLHYGNWLIGGDGNVANECCCGTETGTSPCTGNCDYLVCTNDNPSIRLCVFDADFVGIEGIDWCGETWTESEVQAGATKCVCPTTYVLEINTGTTNNLELWRFNNGAQAQHSLNLKRTVYSSHTFGENVLSLSADGGGRVSSVYGHYFAGGSISSTYVTTSGGGFPGAPMQTIGAPISGSDVLILDEHFFSYVQGGVTYSWARGNNWP